MKTTFNILFFLLVGSFSYLLVSIIDDKKVWKKISKIVNEKNQKYYEELIKYKNKNAKVKLTTKLNLIYRINIALDKAGIKVGMVINPITIIIYSVLSFIVCYYIVFDIFKIHILSIVISLPAILIPQTSLSIMAELKSEKIEKAMLDFVLQLKNYTEINNDIVYAFKQVKTVEPLQGYIDKFLIEINSGIKFEKAIDNIKEKLNFEILKSFFSNIEHCYIYGGSFTKLISKSYDSINKLQKEKATRKQETKSARLVLGILIFLDLFVYFSFIRNNYDNYLIMTTRFLGNVILYWNFISIWLLILLMKNVKKLDY